MIPDKNKEIVSYLIEHFKEVMSMFKRSGVNNVVTDYPTMHGYLFPKCNMENNLLYHKLTHEVVPILEKKNILKRYKVEGKWFFVINKRLKMFK